MSVPALPLTSCVAAGQQRALCVGSARSAVVTAPTSQGRGGNGPSETHEVLGAGLAGCPRSGREPQGGWCHRALSPQWVWSPPAPGPTVWLIDWLAVCLTQSSSPAEGPGPEGHPALPSRTGAPGHLASRSASVSSVRQADRDPVGGWGSRRAPGFAGPAGTAASAQLGLGVLVPLASLYRAPSLRQGSGGRCPQVCL